MGLLNNLKTLVTKGPGGLVETSMKDSLDWSDRYSKADKSDPAVVNAMMEEHRATMNTTMEKHSGLISFFMPAGTKERMNGILANAATDTAAMHQMLAAQKAKTAAEAEAAIPPPPTSD